jgi:hypothetical protein
MAPPSCPDIEAHHDGVLDGLMRYVDRLRTLDPTAWQLEYENTEAMFVRDPRPANRFRFALLLIIADAPYRNETRARELIAAYMPIPDGDPDYRHFGRFLLQMIDERHALDVALENERKQHQLLRKQLNELKAIETQMNRQGLTEQESKP